MRGGRACDDVGQGPGASVRAEEARPLALAHGFLRAGHTDAAPNRARFRACLITRRGDRVRAVGSSGGERAKACGRGPGASVRAEEARPLALAHGLLRAGHTDAAPNRARFRACLSFRRGDQDPLVGGKRSLAQRRHVHCTSVVRGAACRAHSRLVRRGTRRLYLHSRVPTSMFVSIYSTVRSTIAPSSRVRSMRSAAPAPAPLFRARSSRSSSCAISHAENLLNCSSVRFLL